MSVFPEADVFDVNLCPLIRISGHLCFSCGLLSFRNKPFFAAILFACAQNRLQNRLMQADVKPALACNRAFLPRAKAGRLARIAGKYR